MKNIEQEDHGSRFLQGFFYFQFIKYLFGLNFECYSNTMLGFRVVNTFKSLSADHNQSFSVRFTIFRIMKFINEKLQPS